MAGNGLPWFRLYSEILDDKKIKRICRVTPCSKAEVIGVWVCILSLANDSCKRGFLMMSEKVAYDLDDIEEITGVHQSKLAELMNLFVDLDMLTEGGNGYAITKWDDRQFQSDSSSERVKKYRDKREELGMARSQTYDTKAICARDGNKCVYCGSEKNLVVDHVNPIMLDGTDDLDNLVCACKECNSGKAGRTPEMAGMKFINTIAEKRYHSYMNKMCNSYSNGIERDTELNTDTDININSTGENSENPVDVEEDTNFVQFRNVWEQETGTMVAKLDAFCKMVTEFEEVGVTPDIYRQAIQEQKRSTYPVKNPTSVQSWAVGIVQERNKPKKRAEPAGTSGNDAILEEVMNGKF